MMCTIEIGACNVKSIVWSLCSMSTCVAKVFAEHRLEIILVFRNVSVQGHFEED